MTRLVAGQRAQMLTGGEPLGCIARVWDGFYTMALDGEAGLFLVHDNEVKAVEPIWAGRLRHALWRARFGLHLLHEAVTDYWRPPWRKPASDEPWDNIDLRTALEVAWAIWR